MTCVFISHSSADSAIVRRLAQDLKDLGASVWLDEWEIKVGDSISQSIQTGIAKADFVAVWLSNKSLTSMWVEKEWMAKFHQEITVRKTVVLPLLGEKGLQLPYFLLDKRYADFTEEYESGLQELQRALGLQIRRPGLAIIEDLHRANEELERLLRPIGSAIGEIWLDDSESDGWFPHRPASLDAWNPKKGSWKDHRALLGVESWELLIDAMHPMVLFKWSNDANPWPAISDPYADPLSTAFTLDGLLYVRDNAPRLFERIDDRLVQLHRAGVLDDYRDRYRDQIASLSERFSGAGG